MEGLQDFLTSIPRYVPNVVMVVLGSLVTLKVMAIAGKCLSSLGTSWYDLKDRRLVSLALRDKYQGKPPKMTKEERLVAALAHAMPHDLPQNLSLPGYGKPQVGDTIRFKSNTSQSAIGDRLIKEGDIATIDRINNNGGVHLVNGNWANFYDFDIIFRA